MKVIMNLLLLIVFLFASDTSSFADSIIMKAVVSQSVSSGSVSKTGQTTSYVDYDDGYYQKGLPLSGAHFTDNLNKTITDNATNLIWIKDPSAIGGVWGSPGFPSQMTWSDANQNINNLNTLGYAGYSDWRLPTIQELQSIVNFGRSNPAIGEGALLESPWVNTKSSYYWSSTDSAVATMNAEVVSFDVGDSFPSWRMKTFPSYVRPVRDG